MPHYHLNLHNSHVDAPDEEGADFADVSAAREHAVTGIREFLSHEAKGGMVDLRGRIDIADDHGAILLTVPFREAMTIKGL
jgi:hypothetical protein